MNSSCRSIKVLHVDDDQILQETMKLIMEEMDSRMEIICYSDGYEALKELNDTIDCIITDYQMPNLDGIELSKKIRSKTDKPIIIFTGQGSEEVASRAFSIGVNSYIQKDTNPSIYEVLINEIRNNHERYTNSHKIIESEKKYRTFLESSLDGVTFNVNTEIKYCNQQAANLLGYSKDELIGMSVLDVSHSDSIKIIEERTKLRQKGEIVPDQYNAKLLRKDGSSLWVEFHSGLVEFEGEVGSLTFIRDISERMKYQLRLEKLSEYTTSMISVNSLKSLYQITYEILDFALGFKVIDIVAVKDGYLEDVKRAGLNNDRFKVSLDGPGITVRAAISGETQMVNDVRDDADYIAGPRTGNMMSELVVPVFVNNKVFLVLNVESEKVNAFNELDMRLLEIFGKTMGSSIERLLYNDILLEKNQQLENEKQKNRVLIEKIQNIVGVDSIVPTNIDISQYTQ